MPTILTNDELQNLKTPLLYIIGEKEVMYAPHKVVRRLHDVAPQIETIIIPDASHDITHSQSELVNDKVLDFLRQK